MEGGRDRGEERGRDHERIGLVVEAKFPELEVVVEFDQSVRGEGRDHGDDAKKKMISLVQAMMRSTARSQLKSGVDIRGGLIVAREAEAVNI